MTKKKKEDVIDAIILFITLLIVFAIIFGGIALFTIGICCLNDFLIPPEGKADMERHKNTTYIEQRSDYNYAEIKKVSNNSYEICDLETGVHYFLNGGWELIGVNQSEMSLVYNADGTIKVSNEQELNEHRKRMDLNTYMEEE